MITLLTGAPGTGKTAALVDLLRTIGADRPLFVFGLNGLKLAHVPLEDPTKWMEEVPDGAAIVIDEVQQVWRPRGPGKAVPDHIAALETHRHRGLDFFLTTQGPNLLDSNVRALVGRHIHLRDLGWLGRWWYEWPECADQCRTGWRSAPIKKRYKLPKHIFDSYTSASIHIKPVRSFPTALVVAVAALGGTGYFAWHMYGRLASNLNPEAAAASSAAKKAPEKTAPAAKPTTLASTAHAQVQPPKVVSDDPMAERGLHLLGCVTMGEKMVCTLAVSQGGQPAFTVTNRDLEEMGYKFARNGECIVTVTWKGVARSAICDLPQFGQGRTMLASAAPSPGASAPAYAPPTQRISPEAIMAGGRAQPLPQQPQQPRSQWELELAARNAQVKSILR